MEKHESLERILHLYHGYLITDCIDIAVKLKIADLLADGPLHIDEISKRVNVDTDKIYRIMRYLSGEGVFEERDGGEFAQTPLSEQLQANVEGTFQAYTEWVSSFKIEANHISTSALLNDEIPFNKAYGMPVFEYLTKTQYSAGRFG